MEVYTALLKGRIVAIPFHRATTVTKRTPPPTTGRCEPFDGYGGTWSVVVSRGVCTSRYTTVLALLPLVSSNSLEINPPLTRTSLKVGKG